jgi:chitinase
MHSSTYRILAFAVVAATASAAFIPRSKTKTNVYWGQGPDQGRLLESCENSNVDIVTIGFINLFPNNAPGYYPGSSFRNACGDETYKNNGVSTKLKLNCPDIGPDIIACQQLGKKVLLSLGGAYPLT